MNTNEDAPNYTIGELAHLAGVSTRTLRYYDEIGLLTPAHRQENDYRTYTFADLLQLQQIMFFRELNIPLDQIKEILDNPENDRLNLLRQHHTNLNLQIKRLKTLQSTIEKTIKNLEEENSMPLTDEDLYEGFSKEKIQRYTKEAQAQYGAETVNKVNRKLRNMSKSQWEQIKKEGGLIAQALAKFIDRDPADPEVQALIARQHTWIENFYDAPAEVFQGLGEMYATHPEFRASYDQYAPGLADLMKEAMRYYAETVLSEDTV